MMFGIRFDLRNPAIAATDMADRYQAAVEMAEWADQRGALFVGLSEHHGSADGYLPSALAMAAAIAARTSNARIGVSAVVAALHDPLRLAEDAAVVDLLSRGRLDLTVAGGYVREEFEMFGVPISERASRVRETIETLRAAWTGEPFQFRGRTARVLPRPAQPGGPRIVLGGSSEAAARRAARIADGFMPSEAQFWSYYRDECLALGKADPGPHLGGGTDVVIVAEDPEAAWVKLGPYFLHELNSYGAWAAAADGVATGYRPVDSVEALRETGQYRILTPDEYATEMQPAGDMAFAMLHPMVGGVPPALAWEHLRLFEARFLDGRSGA
jgi:alkanesulfonate monooxygenase SsuD/methylene tetrahydromethanopterin reductase-like flavin-dependent oxidoreductase (luciferase family)